MFLYSVGSGQGTLYIVQYTVLLNYHKGAEFHGTISYNACLFIRSLFQLFMFSIVFVHSWSDNVHHCFYLIHIIQCI